MGSDRDDGPIDAIDLIINLLKEHEKILDGLIHRIEEALLSMVQEPFTPPRPAPKAIGVSVVAKKWADFRNQCANASLISFSVEERSLEINAIANSVLYIYEEEIPSLDILYETEDDRLRIEGFEADAVGLIPKVLRGRLDCGLEISIRDLEIERVEGKLARRIVCYVESDAVRTWLTHEIGVARSSIVEGELRLKNHDSH